MNFKKIIITILLIIPTVSCVASSFSRPIDFSNQYKVGEQYMNIRLRGTLEITTTKMTELSGLAWDKEKQILYAISDDADLYHLKPQIVNNTLVGIRLLSAYKLTKKNGKRLKSRDSEGLAIWNGQLIISFERKPKIAKFTPKGRLISKYRLPKKLAKIKNYHSKNKALEAVTIHPRLGVLTAPEYPLKNTGNKHTIYSLKTKRKWTIPAYPARNSAIVALETLKDGSILILERAFSSIFNPLIISVRRVWLSTCSCSKGDDSEFKQIAVFNNFKGWEIDNFEGLTQHKDNYFFMVSDDNNSKLQKTLLTYWELVM
jgi:hypothetical protein